MIQVQDTERKQNEANKNENKPNSAFKTNSQ